jgi:hypothetical protein
MKPWTIKQLNDAMQNDLMACQTDFERSMVKAICGKEIREKAIEWSKTRKLTPGEVAIASQYGFNG